MFVREAMATRHYCCPLRFIASANGMIDESITGNMPSSTESDDTRFLIASKSPKASISAPLLKRPVTDFSFSSSFSKRLSSGDSSMSKGAESPPELAEFLDEADLLIIRSQECLEHLELIDNDPDAIDCLIATLLELTRQAKSLAIRTIESFTQQLHALLDQPLARVDLHTDALLALKDCFSLLSWQLELVDRSTGQLPLDDQEQNTLLETLTRQLKPISTCTCPPPCNHPFPTLKQLL